MIVEVLGLGESLEFYQANENTTVGVNDIWKKVKTDYVVCVDVPSVFNAERLGAIRATNCKGFYSQCLEWSSLPNFKKIEFAGSRGSFFDFDTDKFCYSNSSAFVAVVLAYKLGATEIIMHGVDFISHKHFKGHSYDKAILDFRNLQKELEKRFVLLSVGNKFSALSNFLPVANR